LDVLVNPSGDVGTVQNETSISRDPVTGNLIIVYNDLNPSAAMTGGIGLAVSSDGGQTWTDKTAAIGPNLAVPNDPFSGVTMADIFDPISAADTQGTLYAGFIATDGSQTGPSGLYLTKSTNGGQSWSAPAAIRNDADAAMLPPGQLFRFNDKPHLVVDRFATSPRTDNVYAAWIQDDGVSPQSDLLFSSSPQGGGVWSSATIVNDNLAGPNTDRVLGPNLTVTPNGDLLVAWLDTNIKQPGAQPGTIMVDKSIDGGVNWNALGGDITAATITTVPRDLINGSGGQDVRARSFPVIEADPTDSTGQTLYMTYPAASVQSGDEGDIYFIKSTDGGMTWSTQNTIRVNDDSGTQDQIAPWLIVKPNGTIDIVWYDKRQAPNDDMWDVYIARSTDGGQTFSPNLRVTDVTYATPVTPGGPWIGEYPGITTDGTDALIAFTSGVGDTNNGQIYFDRVPNSTIPEPAGVLMLLGGLGAMVMRRRG